MSHFVNAERRSMMKIYTPTGWRVCSLVGTTMLAMTEYFFTKSSAIFIVDLRSSTSLGGGARRSDHVSKRALDLLFHILSWCRACSPRGRQNGNRGVTLSTVVSGRLPAQLDWEANSVRNCTQSRQRELVWFFVKIFTSGATSGFPQRSDIRFGLSLFAITYALNISGISYKSRRTHSKLEGAARGWDWQYKPDRGKNWC